MRNVDRVRSERPGLAIAELDAKLAVPEPEARELLARGRRERGRRLLAGGGEPGRAGR